MPSKDAPLRPADEDPRVIRYRMLSLLWCFPSLGALGILIGAALRWTPPAPEWGDRWESIPLEAWIAMVLLGLHTVWLWLWRRRSRRARATSEPNNR